MAVESPFVTYPEPFLKWAGGKRLLVPQILPALPAHSPHATYYEPFLGGGALFFAYRPANAILSDVNRELIETFSALRDFSTLVIRNLRRMSFTEDDYYRHRARRPRTPAARAARFIYLNKTCFNGLYRVNLDGEFNVPIGRHRPTVEICNVGQLRKASAALEGAELRAADFEDSVQSAEAGDVVYFDPPYTTAHSNNGFVEYNARVFAWEDQRRLAGVAERLARRGVCVLLSNAYHQSLIDLYSSSGLFEWRSLRRWSTIAGASDKRFATKELLVMSRNGNHRDRG